MFLSGCVVDAMLSLETKLFALSLVWFAMYFLQRVLVGKRRRSRHWFVQYGAMAAYYLPTPLAFYAASTMYYSTSHIDDSTHFLVVGILLMFLNTVFFSNQKGVLFTNMSAYSLGDRPRDRLSILMWLILLGCLDWKGSRLSASNQRDVLLMLGFLCSMAMVLLQHHGEKPQESMDCQTKATVDYMKRLKPSTRPPSTSTSTSPFFDVDADANRNRLLDNCRYPIMVIEEENRKRFFTVKDLFGICCDLSNKDKNICLSYSLSRLLARRYYGFHCAEEGDGMVRRFARADLQGTREERKRAFEIVELQLAFLHDYFFTASLPNIESEQTDTNIETFILPGGFLMVIGGFFCLAIPIPFELFVPNIASLVVAMLCVVLSSYLYLWTLCQTLLPFYWRPIQTAFHELKHPAQSSDPKDPTYRPLHIIGLLKSQIWPHPNARGFYSFQTQGGDDYWSKKLGQYSVLHDFNRHRSLKKELVHWFHRIMFSEPSYEFIKHLPVEEEELDMKNYQDSIANFVAKTLLDGPPTNGTMSLKKNMDEINKGGGSYDYEWLGTCRQETHTDTILIWHIATCCCEMSEHRRSDSSEVTVTVEKEKAEEEKVAMALSRYCAYLVAFLPEFLPEHSLVTKQVFQRVLREAKEQKGEKGTKEEDKRTTFYKGVELGEQLKRIHNREVRWRVIAEFWAETILYVAPSDNAEAHIEHLAKGGEFITHLWAMLSNAGILKRATGEWHPPPASTTTE